MLISKDYRLILKADAANYHADIVKGKNRVCSTLFSNKMLIADIIAWAEEKVELDKQKHQTFRT
jgi:hypothetical protein